MRIYFDAKLQREKIVIEPGEFCSAKGQRAIYTLLGSCIAVCLKDPLTGIGGMNHFMLPKAVRPEAIISTEAGRYGINAMEMLINDMLHKGANRSGMVAKVFGGGHVLNIQGDNGKIPTANIDFALAFLEMEGIPLLASDVGGNTGRKIHFFVDSGNVRVEMIGKTTYRKLHGTDKQVANPFAQNNVTIFETDKGAGNGSRTHRR